MICFGAKNVDKKERFNSSSGGVFLALSKQFVANGGICYGATINDNHEVFHLRIDNVEDLVKITKSKYVKSRLDKEIFENVKRDLEQGKRVLFTGVPCQIAAIKQYLKVNNTKDDLLYCVQVFCHGAPNETYWKMYLNEKRIKTGKQIDFRYKKPSWENYSFQIGKKKTNARKDPYMILFINNCILDKSCFTCPFKGKNEYFDLAIGDFWGIQNVDPKFYDKAGVSIIVSQENAKANELVKLISQKCDMKQTDNDLSLKYNSSFYESAKKPIFYNEISLMLNNGASLKECAAVVNKYTKVSLLSRICRKLGI